MPDSRIYSPGSAGQEIKITVKVIVRKIAVAMMRQLIDRQHQDRPRNPGVHLFQY